MDEEIETLMVDVRASTSGFRSDIEAMRSTIDTSLVDGFARAGDVLERGLLSAIRRGSLGFDDLKRVALQTMGEIASQALNSGLAGVFGGAANGASSANGLSGLLGNALGGLFGLPGRATGGPVSPGGAYLVGERGPELFVPTAAGRVENQLSPAASAAREVRVAITLASPRGSDQPAILRRSSRQVASAIARSLRSR